MPRSEIIRTYTRWKRAEAPADGAGSALNDPAHSTVLDPRSTDSSDLCSVDAISGSRSLTRTRSPTPPNRGKKRRMEAESGASGWIPATAPSPPPPGTEESQERSDRFEWAPQTAARKRVRTYERTPSIGSLDGTVGPTVRALQVSPDPETPAFTAPSHGPAADPPPGPAGGRRRPTAPSQTSSTPSPPPELQRLTEHFAEVDKEVLREGAPVKWVAVDAELAQRREAIIEDGSVRAKDPALAEAYDAYAAEWGGDAPTLSELAGHIPGRIELFLG